MKELEFLSDASAFLVSQLPSWLAAGYLLVDYLKGGLHMFKKLMRILRKTANANIDKLAKLKDSDLESIIADCKAVSGVAAGIIAYRNHIRSTAAQESIEKGGNT